MDAGTTPDDADDSAGIAVVHCVRGSRMLRGRPGRYRCRAGRARQGADRCRRLRELPYHRRRQTICGRKTDRHAVRRHLFAQPDARPRYGPRRLERRRLLWRAALRRGARRLALLPGLPLSEFYKTHAPGHWCDPGLSGDADAGEEFPAAAGIALAAELSRPHARLELAVLQAWHCDARSAEERGMESRPLSGPRRRPLRRLPYAEEHVWRRQTRAGVRWRIGTRHVRATARCRRAQRAEVL